MGCSHSSTRRIITTNKGNLIVSQHQKYQPTRRIIPPNIHNEHQSPKGNKITTLENLEKEKERMELNDEETKVLPKKATTYEDLEKAKKEGNLNDEETKALSNKVGTHKELKIRRESSDCILEHSSAQISGVMCSKCEKAVCIDCHYFSYINEREHEEALREIEDKLVNTSPTREKERSGHYPYTNVMERMQGEAIIDSKVIYIANKEDNLLKILRVTTEGTGEFVLKQILPVHCREDSEVLIEAREEYEIMDNLKDICIRSYNQGMNSSGFEMLMENWGVPLDKCNLLILDQKTFLHVLRESSRSLYIIQNKGIFHGDIKMENLILNSKCFVSKFIDFGISNVTPNAQILLEESFAVNNGERPMKFLKGLTYHMAPPEVLQYVLQFADLDSTKEITYCLNKIDVFCLAMTFFSVIAQDKFRTIHLQNLRTVKDHQGIFMEEIKKVLNESLRHIRWDEEFKLKIIELISCGLDMDVARRPNSQQFYSIFQYFHKLTHTEMCSIVSDVNNSNKIKDLVGLNILNRNIIESIESKIKHKHTLQLLKEYEEKLIEIYDSTEYKNSEEYINLCTHYGQTYMELGNYKLGENWLNRGLELAITILTPLNPDIEKLYLLLGKIYAKMGQYERAEEIFLKSLEFNKEIHGGKAHPDICKCYSELANLFSSQFIFEAAQKYSDKVKEQNIELYGDIPNMYVAQSLSERALLAFRMDKSLEAKEMFNNSINMSHDILQGKQHSFLPSIYQIFGDFCSFEGEIEKADEMFEKAMKMNIEIYGEKGPYVANSYHSKGNSHFEQQNYEKALEWYTKALNLQLEIFGDEPHPVLADSYSDIGGSNKALGNIEKAEQMYNKALEYRLHIFGNKSHPAVAKNYILLGNLYDQCRKDYEKAEEMFTKALNQRMDIYAGRPSFEVAWSYISLGNIAIEKKDYGKAEEMFVKALNERLELVGEGKSHPELASSYNNLGWLNGVLGKLQNSEEMYVKALAQRVDIYG